MDDWGNVIVLGTTLEREFQWYFSQWQKEVSGFVKMGPENLYKYYTTRGYVWDIDTVWDLHQKCLQLLSE